MSTLTEADGEILASIRLLRSGEWSDLTLICSDEDTPLLAHRNILCMRSDYFKNLCRAEQEKSEAELTLQEPFAVVSAVLDFVYTATYENSAESKSKQMLAAAKGAATTSGALQAAAVQTAVKLARQSRLEAFLLDIDVHQAAQKYNIKALEKLALQRFLSSIEDKEVTSQTLYSVLEKLYALPEFNVGKHREATRVAVHKLVPNYHSDASFRSRFGNNCVVLMDMLQIEGTSWGREVSNEESSPFGAPTTHPPWTTPKSTRTYEVPPHVPGRVTSAAAISVTGSPGFVNQPPPTAFGSGPKASRAPYVQNLKEVLARIDTTCHNPECRKSGFQLFMEDPSEFNGYLCIVKGTCKGCGGVFKNLPIRGL